MLPDVTLYHLNCNDFGKLPWVTLLQLSPAMFQNDVAASRIVGLNWAVKVKCM